MIYRNLTGLTIHQVLFFMEDHMQPIGSMQVPEQFSSVVGLGVPSSVFLPGARSRWGSVIFGVLLLGGSVLAVLGGIYYAYDQTQKHGPVVFGRAITAPLFIALCMFALGVWLAFSAFTNWNKAVVLYEKGLAYNDRKGIQVWRWEDIEYFFMAITKHYTNGIYTGTTYVYTLMKKDGSKLALTNVFTKIQDLGNAIEKNVFQIQYQRIVQALNLGQGVALGPIVLSKDGIMVEKKSYVWADVEQVGIQRGFVSVKKRNGGWFSGASTSVAAIPNLDAMLAVIDQIVKVKTG
jgi:hypothetical protein